MRRITLGHVDISETGKKYVNDALANNRLSYGPYTQRLETGFAQTHQSEHAIFCNSGTSALQIALAALKEVHGYQDGDEVLVPATTFIATSNIVIQNGLKPIFVDVDPLTFNIDPNKIEEKITSRTRCIIPVHLFGHPADMVRIMRIAERRRLQVIEDSCETMFAGIHGRTVGSFGDLACFSTYVNHFITGGVGGIVTTSDEKLSSLCRSLMAHGRDSIYTNIDQDDTEDTELLKAMIEHRYSFERVGYSYRATEMEAALALSEFEEWVSNILIRRQNAASLTSLLSKRNELQLPKIIPGFSHSFMMFAMVLDSVFNRDDLLMYLEKNGIETRYLFPLLGQPVYKRLFPGEAEKYPVAQKLAKQGFFIGMHHGLKEEDIRYIAETINAFFGND